MSDTPIHSFFTEMVNAQPLDIAVLFGLVAAQEVSVHGVISPSVKNRLWCLDLDPDELRGAIERLVSSGELEEIDHIEGTSRVVGYRVARFEQLQDLMTDFGKRRYNRIKGREHRQRQSV